MDDDFTLRSRSVMGVELPYVSVKSEEPKGPPYGLSLTSGELDDAYFKFREVRDLIRDLAETENSIYRLAYAIKKAQKRANALKNIVIPGLDAEIFRITDALEEKEREEFVRLKVVRAATSVSKRRAKMRRPPLHKALAAALVLALALPLAGCSMSFESASAKALEALDGGVESVHAELELSLGASAGILGESADWTYPWASAWTPTAAARAAAFCSPAAPALGTSSRTGAANTTSISPRTAGRSG